MVGSLRSILSAPWAYRLFAWLIGSHRSRLVFVEEFVRFRPGQRVLDIGCGTGNLVPYLSGADYLGFDSSPEYIEEARALFGPRAAFRCEPVSRHAVEGQAFDVAIASGVLHHLDDAEALELFRVAHASLRPGGRLVTLDGCYRDGQARLARYLLSRDRGRFVRSLEAYQALAAQVFGEVKTSVRDDLLRVPYTHAILECTRVG